MTVPLCQCGCGKPAPIATRHYALEGFRKGEPRRFIKGHHARLLPKPLDYIVDSETGCWVWQRFVRPDGYGRFRVDGRQVLAHRHYYEANVGTIPDDLVIDHLCRNRRCVNPAHLEAVTHRENILRGEGRGAKAARRDHCLHGHPLSGENLYVNPGNGARQCRACRAAGRRKLRA